MDLSESVCWFLGRRGREGWTILDRGFGRAEDDLVAVDPGDSNAVLITHDQLQGSGVSTSRSVDMCPSDATVSRRRICSRCIPGSWAAKSNAVTSASLRRGGPASRTTHLATKPT